MRLAIYAAVSCSSNGSSSHTAARRAVSAAGRRIVQPLRQLRLTRQDQRQQLLVVGFDVRQQPNFLEQLAAQALRFVDDQRGDLARARRRSRSAASSSAQQRRFRCDLRAQT